MKLQNSYIFLKNPYSKEEKLDHRSTDGTIIFATENNLLDYIKASFPTIIKVDGYGNFYKKKYATDLLVGKVICKVEFIITDVVDTKYLDVVATGNTKAQIVKCLEYIQGTLLSSDLHETYVDIISYDAVSEYYCNKIYPKLNILERNLRKLLFNIYIVNFGRDYYKATVSEELQDKIKGVINKDSRKGNKDQIKAEYKVNTKKEIEEIERLQRFFYSLEYNDIQKLLFTPSWTNADEIAKAKFLDEHANLSELSDEELREAFSQYVPKSDWERFFSNKINIPDISDLIEEIRLYRNIVAHFKFFYREAYDDCNKHVNSLNAAIIKAIKLTEDKDFFEKNAEKFSEALKPVIAGLAAFTKSIVTMAQKTIETVISPTFAALAKSIKHENYIKNVDSLTTKAALLENKLKTQSILENTILNEHAQRSHIDKTQNLLNSTIIDSSVSSLPEKDIPEDDNSSKDDSDTLKNDFEPDTLL